MFSICSESTHFSRKYWWGQFPSLFFPPVFILFLDWKFGTLYSDWSGKIFILVYLLIMGFISWREYSSPYSIKIVDDEIEVKYASDKVDFYKLSDIQVVKYSCVLIPFEMKVVLKSGSKWYVPNSWEHYHELKKFFIDRGYLSR